MNNKTKFLEDKQFQRDDLRKNLFTSNELLSYKPIYGT